MMTKIKLLIIGLIVAFLFTGCAQGKDVSIKNDNVASQETIMMKFDELMQGNPSEKEVIEFVDNNIDVLSKEDATKLVLGMEECQYTNLQKRSDSFFQTDIQKKMWGTLNQQFDRKVVEKLDDKALRDFLLDLLDSGYKIKQAEGMYYIVVDYELYKNYQKYVTDEIKEYIQLKAVESSKASFSDGALNISIDEVYKRAIQQENYLIKYPHSDKYNEIKADFLLYAKTCMVGIDNTRNFDIFTNKMTDKVKESFDTLDLNNANTEFERVIKEYISIVEKNNYKRTEEVQNYVTDAMTRLENSI